MTQLILFDPHQRGWIITPHVFADFTPAGTAIPAWVCCNCRGAVTNAWQLRSWHGCCGVLLVPRCADRGWYDRLPAWAQDINDAWVSEIPTRVGAS